MRATPAATPGTGGLLALHAHPDDETLSTGALLATWAAAGRRVTVVHATRGERGEVIPAALARLEGDGPALAAHREGELAAALDALGVTDHVFLDTVRGAGDGLRTRFADSGMAWVATGRAGAADDVPDDAFVRIPVDLAARRLAVVIRDRRPDVVASYEPGGGYGHPDHVHCHQVLGRAVELAAQADPTLPGAPHDVAAVLWAVLPRAELRAALRELHAAPSPGLSPRDPDGPLPSAAVEGAVDVRVDVRPVLDRVVAALRAHATQVQGVVVEAEEERPLLARLALSDRVLQPLLRHETYRVARVVRPWSAPSGVDVEGPARGER